MGPLRGYGLAVGTVSEAGPLRDADAGLFQRLRLMSRPRVGPVDFEVAYEHALQLRRTAGGVTSPLGTAATVTWLDLRWTLVDEEHLIWSHRLDRLWASFSGDAWEATVGRQAISWATTLFLTPADPFAPFDPSDPFREYRAGLDAARVQIYPGPLSELDLVVRPADTGDGTAVTALVRGRTALGVSDLSAWAGVLHDRAAGAIAGSRSVGAFEIRGEASLRDDPDRGAVVRAAVGADRRFTVLERDLYVVMEYQHDGLGAADPDALVDVAASEPVGRGELQVLGRNEGAMSAAFQVHPLWSLELLGLLNLDDGSGLLVPAAAYAAGPDVTLRGGAFLSFGAARASLDEGLSSEYGAVPASAYASLTWFF